LCLYFIITFIGCNKNHNYTGAVSSGHPEATKIGIQVLENGGNAIDASIAVQLALAVCLPNAGNIGGGGFMICRMEDGQAYALDFREKAPKKAFKNMYLDDNNQIIDSLSTYGSLSVGIPGTIDGIFEAHKKLGSIDIDILFNYAIQLAEIGFPITKRQADKLNYYQQDFIKYNPKNNYLQNDKWQEYDTLKQLDLANTLKIIRDKGCDGFYKGEVAESIIETISENGIITLEDLEDYKSIWRNPINLNFSNYKLISMPPPSSGGIALSQLIMMLSNFDIDSISHNSVDYIHLLSEIEKRVYADRSIYLGDNDYFDVPTEKLLNFDYNKKRALEINTQYATPSNQISHGQLNYKESEETTHFSIIDKDGNAVSVTTTLNTNYGSKVFVNNRGFLLNNEMDDFSSKPGEPNTYGLIGSYANEIEPEKRMLSSMTPTIIEKNNNLFLVLGSPGGSTIITSVFQTILNLILFDMDIQSAVDMPRFHHQWKPDNIYIEKELYSDSLLQILSNMGHKIITRNNIGHVNAVVYENNITSVGADKRGDNFGLIVK
tara:strand:+ start:3798 stop:5441 length:1644 start_codon:yes stop_codon:yes gene_type:complete